MKTTFPVSIVVFIGLLIFFAIIIFGANEKDQLPLKIFDKINKFYSLKLKKGNPFKNEIREEKKLLEKIDEEIINIENQIEQMLQSIGS